MANDQQGAVKIGRTGTKLHPAFIHPTYGLTIQCSCPGTQSGRAQATAQFFAGVASTCGQVPVNPASTVPDKPVHAKLQFSPIPAVAMPQKYEGFEHERNSCGVIALSAVTGVPYADAHRFMASYFERKDRKGVNLIEIKHAKLQSDKATVYGYRVFDALPASSLPVFTVRRRGQWQAKRSGLTVREFVKAHPKGRFMVWSYNHAFAILDGVVYDNNVVTMRTKIVGSFEYVASSECERRGI